MEQEKIDKELKGYIFEDLRDLHDYWGENSFPDMLDFCSRNNLKAQKQSLLILMRPDRIKK